MILAHPHFLWLLILAPVIAWLGYRSHVGGHLAITAALIRFLCVTGLVLALCQPIIEGSSHKPTHVLLIDLNPTCQTPQSHRQRILSMIFANMATGIFG